MTIAARTVSRLEKHGVSAACTALMCAALIYTLAGAQDRLVDFELVLAADVSRSMDLQELALQRQGFAEAIRHADVLRAIRNGPHGRIAVTYMEWAGSRFQRSTVQWSEISNATSAEAFALAIESAELRVELWTSISTAIISGLLSFDGNGFRGLRKVIDISGDGPNNQGLFVVHARD